MMPVLEEAGSENLTHDTDVMTVDEECYHDVEDDNEGGNLSDVSGEGSIENVKQSILQLPQQSQTEYSYLDPNSSVMMFDYDGEDEDTTTGHGDMSIRSLPTVLSEDQSELTWRLDPSESMSDWTLRVVNKGTNTVDEYHLHRNILAVGKRRSEVSIVDHRLGF